MKVNYASGSYEQIEKQKERYDTAKKNIEELENLKVVLCPYSGMGHMFHNDILYRAMDEKIDRLKTEFNKK